MTPDARAKLRSVLRAQRKALDGAARFGAARAVAEHLDAIPAFAAAKRVAGYWAVGGELPLSVVVARLDRDDERTFCLPKLSDAGDATLRFSPWSVGAEVEPNQFGIPEPLATEEVDPSSLDVVLCPLVGFDRRGHRLGTGGGYYDRTFAFRRASGAPPLLIGIAFACQEVDSLEPAEWDVDLDWVVTEREAIECVRLRDHGTP
jgi:5-formyltetrahydrofolate cyclo-ligase